MAGPIYKEFRFEMTEAWYQLSAEEQRSLLAKLAEAREKVGAKPILLCESRWSSEKYIGFGVTEFPDMEAVQKHTALQNELQWSRYAMGESLLGTKWESSS
jgi:hypothetical protein